MELFSSNLPTQHQAPSEVVQINPWQDDVDYFANDAISNSDLNTFEEEGPSGFWAYKFAPIEIRETKKKESNSFDFGTLCHTYLLEKESYDSKYVSFSGSIPNSPNKIAFANDCANGVPIEVAYSNNYKVNVNRPEEIAKKASALYEELCGFISVSAQSKHKKRIKEEDVQAVQVIERNFSAHPFVQKLKALIEEGQRPEKPEDKFVFSLVEQPGYWTEDGITYKFKPDWIVVDLREYRIYHIDLKTAFNNSFNSFMGSIKKWNYDLQIVHYRKGIFHSELLTNNPMFTPEQRKIVRAEILDKGRVDSSIIACRNNQPYNVNVYEFRPGDLVVPKSKDRARKLALGAHFNPDPTLQHFPITDFRRWRDYVDVPGSCFPVQLD